MAMSLNPGAQFSELERFADRTKVRFAFEIESEARGQQMRSGFSPPEPPSSLSVEEPSGALKTAGGGYSVERVNVIEELGRPYRARMRLFCSGMDDGQAVVEQLLGASGCLTIARTDESGSIELASREIRGIIQRVSMRASATSGTSAQMAFDVEMVPALAGLGFNKRCRVFQNIKAIEVIEQVLREGLRRHDRDILNMVRTNDDDRYRTREIIVQYDESDLAFVQRLMEEEGLYYFFAHSSEERNTLTGLGGPAVSGSGIGQQYETLVLVDSIESCPSLASSLSPGKLEFGDKHGGQPEAIHEFNWRAVSPPRTKFSLQSFDWTRSQPYIQDTLRPAAAEFGAETGPRGTGGGKLNRQGGTRPPATPPGTARGLQSAVPERELYMADPRLVYDEWQGHPTNSYTRHNGRQRLELEREIDESRHWTGKGKSTSVSLSAGSRFHLGSSGVEEAGVIAVRVELSGRTTEHKDADANEGELETAFTVLSSATEFRLEQKTPRPYVSGLQSATVVTPQASQGGAGKTDYADYATDSYGRVRVRFAWDRRPEDTGFEESSCWVRVAQGWAGNRYGAHFLPRQGMEVLVSFINGNPDRPLVIGSVNNRNHLPHTPVSDSAGSAGAGSQVADADVGGFQTRIVPDDGASDSGHRLVFDDTADAAEVDMYADENLLSTVEGDEHTSVGRDRQMRVTNLNAETVPHGGHAKAIGATDGRAVGAARVVATALADTRLVLGLDIEAAGRKFQTIMGSSNLTTRGYYHESVTEAAELQAKSLNETMAADKIVLVEGERDTMAAPKGPVSEHAKEIWGAVAGDYIGFGQGLTQDTNFKNEKKALKGVRGAASKGPTDGDEEGDWSTDLDESAILGASQLVALGDTSSGSKPGILVQGEHVIDIVTDLDNQADGIRLYAADGKVTFSAETFRVLAADDPDDLSAGNVLLKLGIDPGDDEKILDGYAQLVASESLLLEGTSEVFMECTGGPVEIQGTDDVKINEQKAKD